MVNSIKPLLEGSNGRAVNVWHYRYGKTKVESKFKPSERRMETDFTTWRMTLELVKIAEDLEG